jgi:hypothetical protein
MSSSPFCKGLKVAGAELPVMPGRMVCPHFGRLMGALLLAFESQYRCCDQLSR